MPDRRRILFLFSDTGGGHRSAAEAIIEALKLEHGGQFEPVLIDVLKNYTPLPFNHLPALYPEMVRIPRAWGLGYRLSDSRQRARALSAALWPYLRRHIRRLVRENPADVIVSVHPLLNAPVLRALGRRRPPFLTVVTDLVSTHALWYHQRAERCLVPTQAARQRALECGLSPRRVDVVGLPVAQRFCQQPGEPADLRRQLGWPLDRPMVLLVGGGEGMGPIFETACAIASKRGRYGLAVIAGRNTRLRQRLEAVDWDVPTFIYGFEKRMPEMMQAATLLVTKAGPGTITEALNAGLPMVLYSRLPGQEDGNVGYVVEQGVGVWAPGPLRTAAAVHDWLARPGQLKQAAATCRALARPDAASTIANTIWSYPLRSTKPEAQGAQLQGEAAH